MEDMRGVLPDNPVRFMHKLRAFVRAKNLAYTTEKTYSLWIKRYIFYHNKQHPEKGRSGVILNVNFEYSRLIRLCVS